MAIFGIVRSQRLLALGRLAKAFTRDPAGNTLVIAAAAIIPMTAMAGSAIDMARLYTVKARLQQACDAGALAGRRFMTGTTLDDNAKVQAGKFFGSNFPTTDGTISAGTFTATQGWFLTKTISFTPVTTGDGQVAATAVATVPMTIMGKALFGAKPVTLTATCEARLEITNADVMFVLDTTGSMACAASETSGCSQPVVSYSTPYGTRYYTQEKSSSKIVALRTAVLNFYDTLSAAVDSTARVRFGFVTYTSTTNVGYSLPSSYLVDSADYQSRVANYTTANHTPSTGSWSAWGNEQTFGSSISSSNCDKYGNNQAFTQGSASFNPNPSGNPAPAVPTATVVGGAKPADVTSTQYRRSAWSGSGTGNGTCKRQSQTVVTTYNTRYKWDGTWTYQTETYDTSSYKAGSSLLLGEADTSTTVATSGGYNARELATASGWTGSTTSSKWDGCIEERTTTASTSFDQSSLPADLDIDLLPTSAGTRWKPVWPDVVFYRSGASAETGGDRYSYSDPATASSYLDQGYYTCGKAALKLNTMTRSAVSNFVNADDFRAMGGTYHDTGMIWGARFISPTGIFASENDTAPNGKPISRNIIFMTDGDMAPNESIYGMYGLERVERRVSGSASTSTLEARHNARFAAVCEEAKAKNITVWVVAFGQSMTSTLSGCASSGKAYYASNNAELEEAFQNIAKQIADLRLSK